VIKPRKNQIDGACGTYGEEEIGIQRPVEDPGVDGRVILNVSSKKWDP
jgi:hypothetical protein